MSRPISPLKINNLSNNRQCSVLVCVSRRGQSQEERKAAVETWAALILDVTPADNADKVVRFNAVR